MPFNHLGLVAAPMLRGMSDAQLAANADVAREAVARLFTDARSWRDNPLSDKRVRLLRALGSGTSGPVGARLDDPV